MNRFKRIVFVFMSAILCFLPSSRAGDPPGGKKYATLESGDGISHDSGEHVMNENIANDVVAITQLVARERQSRVRYLGKELSDCFFPDATVTTSWTSGEAKKYLARTETGKPDPAQPILNRLGTPVVRQKGYRAVVELPSITTRWTSINGVEVVLASFMRLIYRVEKRNDIWKIVDLTTINEGDTIEPAIPGTNLGIEARDVEGFRLSYRYLAYMHSLSGSPLSRELFGIDRPEEVDKLYAEAFAWRDAAAEDAGAYAKERAAIENTFALYAEGQRQGRVELTKQAFHPAALVFPGPEAHPVQEFFDRLAELPPAKGLVCEIASLDWSNNVAMARVELFNCYGRRYTDMFTLVKMEDGDWKITCKVSHRHPEDFDQ